MTLIHIIHIVTLFLSFINYNFMMKKIATGGPKVKHIPEVSMRERYNIQFKNYI